MRQNQPNSNVQISKKTPDEFLKRACEIARQGWGQPAFYNTDEMIEELVNKSKGDYAYSVFDIDTIVTDEMRKALSEIEGVLKVRAIQD